MRSPLPLLLPLLAVALTSLPTGSAAQRLLPVSGEIRAGAAFPTGHAGSTAGTGYGYGGSAKVGLAPFVSVYGSYDEFDFGASGEGGPSLNDNGYALGGELSLPLVGTVVGFSPWVRGGAAYRRLGYSVPREGGRSTFYAERALGYEVGAGATVSMLPMLRVVPSVQYRSYAPEFGTPGQWPSGEDFSYVALTLGIALGL